MQAQRIRGRSIVFGVMSLILLCCPALIGQEGLSTIRGTVTDSSGGVVPGVKVESTDVSTSITVRTVETDAQGNFEMPGLKIANYQVTATKTGFKKAVVDNVMLQSNQVRRVDITLEVGEITSEVTVSAAATAIQTEQATIGADFNAAKRYWDLPIPGNAFSGTYAVLAVLPEVQREPGDWGSPRFAGQGGDQVNMGQDGIKEETLNSQTVNMEGVAEVKAVAVNATAEYSRVGYFDTISKSGTNQLHGEASYYHRNSALGARNFFEDQRAKVIYHTFNFSAGGPIKKDKTFFYGLWNGERVPAKTTYLTTVPTDKMRTGDFSELLPDTQIINPFTGQPFPGNVIDVPLSGVATMFQQDFIPTPDRPGTVGNLSWVHPYPDDQFRADVFLVRVDHNFSEKHSMYGRFQGYLPRYVNAGVYPTFSIPSNRQSHSWAVTDVYSFSPTLINTFTFGGNRDGIKSGIPMKDIKPVPAAQVVADIGLEGVNLANVTDVAGSPEFIFPDPYPTLAVLGEGGAIGFTVDHRNFTYADNITWAKGKHVLKFGFEQRSYYHFDGTVPNDNYGSFNFDGSFTGYSYADFLLGLPLSSTRENPILNRAYSTKELGLFITDTFKVSPKLTLDVGLRWDRFSATTYDDGLMFNWDPASGDVVVPSSASSSVSPFYPANINVVTGKVIPDSDMRNFVPRIGVAYRLTDKTVIRGGYGIYNEFLGQFGGGRLQGGGPFAVTETYFNSISGGVPLFEMPDPFPSGGVSPDVPSQSVTAVPLHTKNGQIHQFNATVERQVRDIGVRLSYIGARNRNLNYSLDVNKPEPSLTPFDDSRRPFPQFVETFVYRTDGATNYDSLSFAANRRVGWVTFDAHWTWAHGMNNMLNLENPYAPLPWNRDFFAKNRVVFNTVWELPFGRGRRFLSTASGAANQVVGGWRLVWVTYLQNGQYFSPAFSGGDPSNTNTFGGFPDRICNGNLPTGERSVNHWFDESCFAEPPAGRFGNSGANILEGPGMHVHNFTILKRFPITERVHFDFMGMISNIFNHPNFLFPVNDISAGAGSVGVITETYGLYSGERAGQRMVELRGRLEF